MNGLTICIPTIASRRSLLSRLLWSLPEMPFPVEVLVADGAWGMGDKLDAMFNAARMSHVICVDDDDMLLPGPWALPDVDFVGHRVLYTEDGRFGGSVAHRGDGDTSWATFDRGVSPKCPIRTEIAKATRFGNHYTADREWSQAVQADITSHAFIDAHLYHYDHFNSHMVGTAPEGGRLDTPQRDVGIWPYNPEVVTWL